MQRFLLRDAARVEEWLRSDTTIAPDAVLLSVKRLAADGRYHDKVVAEALEKFHIGGLISPAELALSSPFLSVGEDPLPPLDVVVSQDISVTVCGSILARRPTPPAQTTTHAKQESSADVASEIHAILRSVRQGVATITNAISDEGGVLRDSEALIARTLDRTLSQSESLDRMEGVDKRRVGPVGRALHLLLPAPVAATLLAYLDGIVAFIASVLWTAAVLAMLFFGWAVILWFPKV